MSVVTREEIEKIEREKWHQHFERLGRLPTPESHAVDVAARVAALVEERKNAEIARLRSAVSEYEDRLCKICGYYAPENEKEWPESECVVCTQGEEIARLSSELSEAIRERDLAVAHDRQPYPTAYSYEQVCAADAKKKAEIARLRRELREAREAIREAWRIDNDPAGDLSLDWYDHPAVRAAMEEGEP